MIFATIQNGKIILDNKLDLFKLEGKRIEISLIKKKRSLNQNDYYWGVVIAMIASDIGEDNELVHDILRAKFLSEKKIVKIGLHEKEVLKLLSTKTLNKSQFEEYLEKCRQWSYKFLNVMIPLPNDIL